MGDCTLDIVFSGSHIDVRVGIVDGFSGPSPDGDSLVPDSAVDLVLPGGRGVSLAFESLRPFRGAYTIVGAQSHHEVVGGLVVSGTWEVVVL